MFSRFSAVDRNKTKRKKTRPFADTVGDTGWSPRSIVSVFGLGFGVTFVLLAACIGVYYLLPTKSAPAPAPVAHRDPPLEVEDSVGVVPVSDVGEAAVPDTTPATVGEADAGPVSTQVLGEEPKQAPVVDAAPPPVATPVAPPPSPSIPQDMVAMAAPPPASESARAAASSAPGHRSHAVAASGSGTLIMYGQDTRIPIVRRQGLAYVPAEAVAVRSGLDLEMSPSGDVTFDGHAVQGALTDGDAVLVPVQSLGAALHCRAHQTGSSWCLDKRAGGAEAADAPPPPVAHHHAHHQDALATVAVTHSDVPPAPADDAPPVPAPAMAPMVTDVPASGPVPEAFRPVIQSNGDIEITVTNVELVSSFRDTYKPSPGKQFAVVSLSMQNQSDIIQMTTGTWELRDQNNASSRSLDRISTLVVGTMRAAGIDYGYLVFEVDQGSTPTQLVYTQTGRSPLVVALH